METQLQVLQSISERIEGINKNRNGISWYLSFKQPPEKCINMTEGDGNRLEEK